MDPHYWFVAGLALGLGAGLGLSILIGMRQREEWLRRLAQLEQMVKSATEG